MKFTKINHPEENCIEHITKYMGHEAADSPDNTVYDVSSVSPHIVSGNLIIYVDSIRRYEDDDTSKDYKILNGRSIKFNYKISNNSTVQLIVTEKIQN